jgi:mannonate dehydratase
MRRRDLLASSVLLPAALPRRRAAAAPVPRGLRITDVRAVVTNPSKSPNGNYVLVKVLTSEAGLWGWGDATCTGSELAVAKMIEEHLRPALVGRNPMELERLWQTLFFLPYYRSGSVQMSAISGLDMALWDIKGRVAGLPVYELLGGKVRDKLLAYAHASGRDPVQVEDNVRALMAKGYRAIRAQVATPGVAGGYGVPPSAAQKAAADKAQAEGLAVVETWDPAAYVRAVPRLFEHLRKKLGDAVELLHDVHERVTPSQALGLARALEPYRLFFFEDPVRPEHLDTFRLIRQQSAIPIAMGEVYTAAWEGLGLVTEHLIDYVRHDLAHCGGITTGKKVATVCEPYGILTAWHGPSNISPITHMANCHVDFSIPNFGIQEETESWAPGVHEVFSAVPRVDKGFVTIDEKPGLGVEVNERAAAKYPYIKRSRPMIRLEDGTPWPY